MFLGRLEALLPDRTLADPKAVRASAEKIGPFRIAEEAVFMPNGTYLLRSDIQEVSWSMAAAHVTGCCAGGVPVPRVVFVTASKKFPILCDSKAVAEQITAALQ